MVRRGGSECKGADWSCAAVALVASAAGAAAETRVPGGGAAGRRAGAAADLAARSAAGRPRLRRARRWGRRTTPPPAASCSRRSPPRRWSPRRRRRRRRCRGCSTPGVWWIVTLADADTTVALADVAGDRALVLNAAATDDRLRGEDCRANLLHVAPSDAMLDRRAGAVPGLEALDRLVPDRGQPSRGPGAGGGLPPRGDEVRRARSSRSGSSRTPAAPGAPTPGTVQVQAQMPAFTQRAPEHDVVVAADRAGVFAAHLPYHTWEPRPVAGSAGLVPADLAPGARGLGRRPSCRPASRSRRAGRRGTRTIRSGWRSGCSARRRRGRRAATSRRSATSCCRTSSTSRPSRARS